MEQLTIEQRIFRSKGAEQRLKDDMLNAAFDGIAERWLRAIVNAKPNQGEEVLEAKRQIDAIIAVRTQLKAWVDDGVMAIEEQKNG